MLTTHRFEDVLSWIRTHGSKTGTEVGKPLIYQLACARLQHEAAGRVDALEALRLDPRFRRAMMLMTLSWGVMLIAQSAACGALVFVLSIKWYLIVSPIIGYAALGAMTACSFWYGRRRIAPLRRDAGRASAQTTTHR